MLLAEDWNNCHNLLDMLRLLLHAPEFANPDRLDNYIDWLWQELRETKEWLLEARSVDFETRTIWSRGSIEGDLVASRIDQTEATRRRRLGAIHTARLNSDLVLTAKVEDAEFDKIWRGKTDIEETIESTVTTEQAAKLREVVGNPFL